MERKDDGPKLVVFAPPFFGKIDLEAIADAVEFDSAIEEAGLLRRL
jgi:hypothetical protein